MGRRRRERIERIRRGEEMSIRERRYWEEQERKLDALERISQEFGGKLVAEELRRLGQERRLNI